MDFDADSLRMTDRQPSTRRRVLKLGAAASTALIAGCGGPGDGGDENETGMNETNETGMNESNETGMNETNETGMNESNETEMNETNETNETGMNEFNESNDSE
ncbi:hypothetical protein NJ7G_4008 [Natrinema sp. J7-2]|nr:hypothetical protein NJ7G_4008 [Natrinema sp. J7-2]